MKAVFLTAAILIAAAANGYSQEERPGTGAAESNTHPAKSEGSVPEPPADIENKTETSPIAVSSAAESGERTGSRRFRARIPVPYVRPEAETRFKNYLEATFGPESLVRYGVTAGLLTLRNSPKEWGAKPDGYARRFLNVTAKNAVRTTAIYGLDEVLKVDSTFYLSRDRSVAARLRNAVFSSVTARNRRGHRVIGLPRLAGSFGSEVLSSTAWYPGRYDQDHGFKGGAISIGISTAVNLFREFVWKR